LRVVGSRESLQEPWWTLKSLGEPSGPLGSLWYPWGFLQSPGESFERLDIPSNTCVFPGIPMETWGFWVPRGGLGSSEERPRGHGEGSCKVSLSKLWWCRWFGAVDWLVSRVQLRVASVTVVAVEESRVKWSTGAGISVQRKERGRLEVGSHWGRWGAQGKTGEIISLGSPGKHWGSLTKPEKSRVDLRRPE
jgi:hypothetical protein